MAIFTGSKPAGNRTLNPDGTVDKQGKQHLENAAEAQWGRYEPLLTPEQLKSRFLKGISMTLRIKDPTTGKFFVIQDEELKDYIDMAVEDAETETGSVIMPTQFSEKLLYQRQDYEQYGYWKLPRKPVSSIERLSVQLADGADVFNFPLEWIETANLIHGQLNIIPLAFQSMSAGGTSIIGGAPGSGTGNAVYFNSLWNRPWVSALFGITYTAGWKDGLLPKVVNNLIGTIAAMRVLSQIAAAYALYTSTSLGIDGMSQSVTTPGPQRFQVRMTELKEDRALYVKKLKKMLGLKIFSGTV